MEPQKKVYYILKTIEVVGPNSQGVVDQYLISRAVVSSKVSYHIFSLKEILQENNSEVNRFVILKNDRPIT